MKNTIKLLLLLFTFLSTTVLLNSCNSDDSRQDVIIEDINKLSEDPLFLEYLQKESDATTRIVDLRVGYALQENLQNLTDVEEQHLAESLGYIDVTSMKAYILGQHETRLQLDKKYKFSLQDRDVLNEITFSVINKNNLFFNIGSNTNSLKYKNTNDIDPCFLEAIELTSRFNVCNGRDFPLFISGSEFPIGTPFCSDLDSGDRFPCLIQKNLGHYYIAYNEWADLACCVFNSIFSVECNSDINWCSAYLCC